MRQSVLALVVAAVGGFAVASCGNSNNNGDGGGSGDMAGTGGGAVDMAVAKTNCKGMANCVYTCIIGGSDINTCATQCSKNAKAGTANKWIAAVICGQNYCLGDQDMMSGKCVTLADPANAGSSDLCDPGKTFAQCTDPTYMSTSCNPCLDDSRNMWVLDESVDPANPGPPTFACAHAASADCTGAQTTCMASFNACLNNP